MMVILVSSIYALEASLSEIATWLCFHHTSNSKIGLFTLALIYLRFKNERNNNLLSETKGYMHYITKTSETR